MKLDELNYKDKIVLDEVIDFPEEFIASSPIKKLHNVKTNGFIFLNELNEYAYELNIKGIMDLSDSVTLENVSYPFDFNASDVIPENCINNENTLDIMELLWENIVLEVPISYTESDAQNLKGENWEVVSEHLKEDEIDPRMQKLYDYYNKGGE